MSNLLKSHARQVAQGIIANIILWLLTLGVGAILSYVAAHSAFVKGLPAYEVVLAGVGTFFLLASGVYLLAL
jgi:hypothetical protein